MSNIPSKQIAIRHSQFVRRYLLRQGCEFAQTADEIGLFEVATFLESLPDETSTQLKRAKDLVAWLPITTEELIRLRNANKITFDKQVNSITTCLIQLRYLFEESAQETKSEPQATSMDYGGVGQVGCEGDDGLLRIHRTNETCDVCSSQKASGEHRGTNEDGPCTCGCGRL